jgi:hypothetical protein
MGAATITIPVLDSSKIQAVDLTLYTLAVFDPSPGKFSIK